MKRQVTLRDVAAEAGVSSQTVSRVVNGKPEVSEATRRRVWDAVRRLGYRPNSIARSLASQRTYSLGLITWSVNDAFRSAVIMGAQREALLRGYVFLLSVTEGSREELHRVCNLMLERQVDGLLLLAPATLPPEPLDCEQPIVSLAYPLSGPRVLNVDVDNVDGAYQAVSYLVGLGHRRIGMIAGPMGWKATEERIEGARRALAGCGQNLGDSWVIHSEDWTLEAGHGAARELLARHGDLSAFFCHNDWLALGALRALYERGLSVPEDVSIIGYDDLPMCLYMTPSLSSVWQPRTGLGQLLAQLLIDAVEHGARAQHDVVVKASLVVRESVGPVSATLPARCQGGALSIAPEEVRLSQKPADIG